MAESSLGKLIVEISVDLAEMQKGLNEAEDQVKDKTQKITDLTNKMGVALTAVGASIVGAFGLMVHSTVEYSNEIFETSQRTGIATEKLSQLKFVAEQTEASFADVSTGLKFLNKSIFEAAQGNEKFQDTFTNLNVKLTDSNGKLKTTDAVFLELADRFKNITDQSEKTALAIQLFGRSGTNLIPVLNLGSEGILKMQQRADQLGLTLTTSNAKAIDEFDDNLNAMKASLGGLFLQISVNVLPTLKGLVDNITNVIIRIQEWAAAHPRLSSTLANVTLTMGGLFAVLGPVIITIGVLISSFQKIGGAIILIMPIIQSIKTAMLAFILNPITLVVAGIATFALAWANNWGNIQGIARDSAVAIGHALDSIRNGMIRTILIFQNLGEIPIKERLLHPIESLQKATETADAALKALADEGTGELTQFADSFDAGMKRAIDTTEELKQKLADLMNQGNKEVDLGGLGLDTSSVESFTDQFKLSLDDATQKTEDFKIKLKELGPTLQEGLDFSAQLPAEVDKRILSEQNTQAQLAVMRKEEQAQVTVHENILSKIRDNYTQLYLKAQKNSAQTRQQLEKSTFDNFVSLLEQASEHSKVAAGLLKGIRIAEAVINTAAGVTQALAAYPPPISFIMAALVSAVGAAQIALISGAQFATGTDTVPAMLTPGEMIVPRTFSDAIRSGDLSLSGPGQAGAGRNITVQNTFTFENVTLSNNVDLNALTEALGSNIEKQLRRI